MNAIFGKKIFFLGTSFFAEEILVFLLENKTPIHTIFTAPSRPKGRGRKLEDSKIKEVSLEKQIPLLQPNSFDDKIVSFFEKEKPDLVIVVSFGLFLPKKVLNVPKFGSINIHPSLLPEFRGPSPIQWALLSGKKTTGVSLMLLDEKMDAGDILAQEKVTIEKQDEFLSLQRKLLEKSKEMLIPTLENWLTGKIAPKKQNDSKVTFSKIIKKEDGRINWQENAEEIFNKGRAFSVCPKIYSFWKDKKIIFCESSFENKNFSANSGEILNIDNQVAIQCGQGILIPQKIQLEGKNTTDIKAFLNGHQDFLKAKL